MKSVSSLFSFLQLSSKHWKPYIYCLIFSKKLCKQRGRNKLFLRILHPHKSQVFIFVRVEDLNMDCLSLVDFHTSIFVSNDYSFEAISKDHNKQFQLPFWHIHTEPTEQRLLSTPRNFVQQIFGMPINSFGFEDAVLSGNYSFQSPSQLLLKTIHFATITNNMLILIKLSLTQFSDFPAVSIPEIQLFGNSQGNYTTLRIIPVTLLSPIHLLYMFFQAHWLPWVSPIEKAINKILGTMLVRNKQGKQVGAHYKDTVLVELSFHIISNLKYLAKFR